MKFARKPNAAVQLLFSILYEKYKPKIAYTPASNHQSINHHDHRLDEESETMINNNPDDETKSDRALSQENVGQMNWKRGHQKSRSDASGNVGFN